MKKIIYLLTLVILSSCHSSYVQRIQEFKSQYPDEIVVGELIQLSNNQFMGGDSNWNFISGNSEFGSEYFYTGLYRDSLGHIETFKLPANEVYFVESDTCMIIKTGIHKYIEMMIPRTFKCESYKFINEYVNGSVYIKSMHVNEYATITTDCNLVKRPKIKIFVPIDSIQKYINITY